MLSTSPQTGATLVAAVGRHGIRYVVAVLLMWLACPVWRRRPSLVSREKQFLFRGRRLDYFYHRYNLTWLNERAVEIPIIREMIGRHEGERMLEVGNVLSHYFRDLEHDVVDKYERGRRVLNVDVVDFSPSQRYDLIVSISTLEHVGWDEAPRDPDKIPRALAHLRQCLNNGGRIVVTVPVGYNEFLDRALQERRIEFSEAFYLRRTSRDDTWVETTREDALAARWSTPFAGANALIVGVILARDG